VTAANSPTKSLGYTPESWKLSESLHASLLPSLRSAGDFRDFVVGRLRGLAKHVREIRMAPAKDANNQERYFAEREWNLLGELDTLRRSDVP
jgi:hypothetical protein